jgi:hypothetical protein
MRMKDAGEKRDCAGRSVAVRVSAEVDYEKRHMLVPVKTNLAIIEQEGAAFVLDLGATRDSGKL